MATPKQMKTHRYGHSGGSSTGCVRVLTERLVWLLAGLWMLSAMVEAGEQPRLLTPPTKAQRPAAGREAANSKAPKPDAAAAPMAVAARAERLQRLGRVRSWGYQLSDLDLVRAERSPYDLLVVDATTGLPDNKGLSADQVRRLKVKPDGGRRLVISYLSIGEAEDYRSYFDKEYLEEDAPDWLLKENPRWKGNRIIRFCEKGWQETILGDADGRSPYNSIDASPLRRLVDLGFDGVYLDRVDVYAEVTKQCPDAANQAVAFVARLGAQARRWNPGFMVILQNAEELLRRQEMLETIDGIAKEDLVHRPDDSGRLNSAEDMRDILGNLRIAKAAGRTVLVVDYAKGREAALDARRRIEAEGFVAYIGPRNLDHLTLPGADF
jgi:cysteinyl-tRNA synthetase